MSKFYDPSQPEQSYDSPKLFGIIPIKFIVSFLQLVSIVSQILWLYSENDKIYLVLLSVGIVLNVFTVVVFIKEHKLLMRAHYYSALIFTVVPFIYAVYTFISFIELFFGDKDITFNQCSPFAYAFIFLCIYIFYLAMCRVLIKASEFQPDDMPDLDTTQGLFHYNRDAYDGGERAKLMYGEV
ncbi:uncharacterized protein CELE_C48B4.10 [Caenorhabditis elegans]|uniref:Uncharacterized protein C48B4.10 n=1 Tax=Caenorhabditis elegans TaxID=6239 RepID=YLH0_CAEEL|nr:Uncharacterized protein CELE_C48B4.10 [Caenorhabditis elegans]P34364.2 RecName: Full=Uncharacterized protein C48B4.10 [Caenorhabditis elegans]CAA82375.2 Uncharacterized protein CELE_C48B4.10 [Caenorhabditis elegans]|eukprot:NP_499113.2 Uncharacterized protein CELE_C48B4.10 [Caenorhabditis elegans]